MRNDRPSVTNVTVLGWGWRYHRMGNLVSVRVKVAAVMVLASLLAAPAMALSSCWGSGGPAAQPSCVPDCPMMAHSEGARAVAQAQAQPEGSTCCQVSSDKTAPRSQMLVPTMSSTMAPPAAHAIASGASAQTQAHTCETASPPTISLSQSALCTFLI